MSTPRGSGEPSFGPDDYGDRKLGADGDSNSVDLVEASKINSNSKRKRGQSSIGYRRKKGRQNTRPETIKLTPRSVKISNKAAQAHGPILLAARAALAITNWSLKISNNSYNFNGEHTIQSMLTSITC